MNGVGAGDLRRSDEARNVQVGVARRRRANTHVVVREANMKRLTIGVGVDGYGFEAKLAARANDAQSDLATIGDEDFLEHARGAGLRIGARY